MNVVRVGTRLVLLLAVLIQYTPVRVCAIEQAALGRSCHDSSSSIEVGHGDEPAKHCGSQADPTHDCICEQAKVDGQHHVKAEQGTLDWAQLAVVPVVLSTDAYLTSSPDQDADSPPNLTAARQLPLLI